MKSLSRTASKFKFWGIIMIFGLVLGIPAVVLGPIFKIWALLIVGIVGIICGMYVMPFMWSKYGTCKRLLSVQQLIVMDNILSLQQLSINLNWHINNVRRNVVTLISKRYIVGYLLTADNILVKNEMQEEEVEFVQTKCPNCGASLNIDNNTAFCPYCNSQLIKK